MIWWQHRDQDKRVGETLWLDPRVPVIEVGKELGQRSARTKRRDRISGRREATGGDDILDQHHCWQ